MEVYAFISWIDRAYAASVGLTPWPGPAPLQFYGKHVTVSWLVDLAVQSRQMVQAHQGL